MFTLSWIGTLLLNATEEKHIVIHTGLSWVFLSLISNGYLLGFLVYFTNQLTLQMFISYSLFSPQTSSTCSPTLLSAEESCLKRTATSSHIHSPQPTLFYTPTHCLSFLWRGTHTLSMLHCSLIHYFVQLLTDTSLTTAPPSTCFISVFLST